jgi:hypothetical protein
MHRPLPHAPHTPSAEFSIYQTKSIILSATAGNTPPMCVDISNFNTNPGAEVWTWPCGDGSKANEWWTITASSIASQQTPSTCLAAESADVGAAVTTAVCSATDPLQQLAYSPATQLIVHTPSGLCVDGGSALPPEQWCAKPPQANWTICDASAALDDRAADIVARLSLADKIAALGTGTPRLPSIALPSYQWWSEATHGISGPGVGYDSQFPAGSNTALPITTSCSFNRSLWHATGNQIAREGRIFRNHGLAASTFWTPVINIVRDPRWGRNLESAGEDPFVSGEYAVNFIQGFEHAKETSYPLQASACCECSAQSARRGKWWCSNWVLASHTPLLSPAPPLHLSRSTCLQASTLCEWPVGSFSARPHPPHTFPSAFPHAHAPNTHAPNTSHVQCE